MTRTLAASLLLLLSVAASPCRADDEWLSGDKRAHFLGGVVISGAVSYYTESATAGVLTSCSIAAAGEVVSAAKDGWNSHHVSAKDFAAGCLGGVVAGFAGVYIAPN